MQGVADVLYWAMNASIVSTSWANAVERTTLDGALDDQTEQTSATLSSPQRWHDVLGEHGAIAGYGRWPAAHRDMFTLIALGELGHRRSSPPCDRNGCLSVLDAGSYASGFLAGLVRRDIPVSSHGDALRRTDATSLDDVDLGAPEG